MLGTKQLLVALLVIGILGVSYANPCGQLDSLNGDVEIKRAGEMDWELATAGNKVCNNDIIRVLANSSACLRLPDSNVVYLHQDSRINLNFSISENNKTDLNHLTVFFGAAFFVIKKVLPRSLTEQSNDTKIYTPTGVISIRGTSFSLSVAPKDGVTTIKMINGTVKVSVTKTGLETFLRSPYKFRMEKTTRKLEPQAILRGDIDSLRQWIPSQIIDNEMAKQLKNNHRETLIMHGLSSHNLLIECFDDSMQQSIALQTRYELTKSFVTYLENMHIPMAIITSGCEPMEVPDTIQYAISGTLIDFNTTPVAQITTAADNYYESLITEIKIRIKLHDLRNNTVIMDTVFDGTASYKEEKLPDSTDTTQLHTNSSLCKTIFGQAVSMMIKKAGSAIIDRLSLLPHHSSSDNE